MYCWTHHFKFCYPRLFSAKNPIGVKYKGKTKIPGCPLIIKHRQQNVECLLVHSSQTIQMSLIPRFVLFNEKSLRRFSEIQRVVAHCVVVHSTAVRWFTPGFTVLLFIVMWFTVL